MSRTAQTWVGSLLIGLALFCAVQGYLSPARLSSLERALAARGQDLP